MENWLSKLNLKGIQKIKEEDIKNCKIYKYYKKKAVNAESIAYWFFRLNGCFTIENFVIHPDIRGPQRTDIDILLVRFPYRRELDMKDHEIFEQERKRIFVGIAEVKSGICNLNGPWINENKKNLHKVLKSIGFFPNGMVDIVANSLYKNTYYKNSRYHIRLIAVGKERNQELQERYLKLIQLTYKEDILPFIFNRFKKYSEQKAHHPQWDEVGHSLYKQAETAHNVETFLEAETFAKLTE